MQPDRALGEPGATLVLARQRDGPTGEQLAAQPLELDAGALELGRSTRAAQRGLRGHLRRAAAQDAVAEQLVDGGTRLGHRVADAGQVDERCEQVGHAGRR